MMTIMILLSVVKFYKPILTKYYVLDILETNNIVDLLAEYLIFQNLPKLIQKYTDQKLKGL
jgi:hypothetical protein